MSEAKFTKAPWESVPDNRTIRVKPTQDQRYMGGTYVCSINLQQYDGKEEANANAHLIAAAPEMYELFQKILNHNCRESCVCCLIEDFEDNIRELLKKARGEV